MNDVAAVAPAVVASTIATMLSTSDGVIRRMHPPIVEPLKAAPYPSRRYRRLRRQMTQST
jgi:hypothetical protein